MEGLSDYRAGPECRVLFEGKSEDAELNLIAGQVQESWAWYEKLADDRMYKAEQA